MINSTAIGITKPAGKLGDLQDDRKKNHRRGTRILMHPVCRWSQEVDYLLVVESNERGDSANQEKRNIIP